MVSKIANEGRILSVIYAVATASKTGSIWVSASLFDGRTLRRLERNYLIEYSKNGSQVTLTEEGVGVHLFKEGFAQVLECL